MQIVYFNPPVGGIVSCTIDFFSYLDNVLRLDTSACVTDFIFRNGFEGVPAIVEGCIGSMCP